ncbi:MAG: DUF3795 domain-containing protein [Armatimonadota bacterium]|nr:DUF3795 domain-containing protein [bacterium]
MDKLIGACGLDCTACKAYKATQANDPDAIAQVAAEWSKEFNADIKPEHVWCDACMTASSRKCGHCAECETRACVEARGIANCAYCDEYPCENLSRFLSAVPCAKSALDEIRQGLTA